MRRISAAAVLFAILLVLPSTSSAQSAQMFSLQFSGLVSAPFGGDLEQVTPGPGFEAQIRLNPSLWSFGFGVEATFHELDAFPGRTLNLLGGFFEPRIVVPMGSAVVAPYLALRLAASQQVIEEGSASVTATGFTVNGGGGLLFRLSSRVNLDMGATVGYKKLGSYQIAGGATQDLGTGQNVVGRVGLAIGLGG